VGADRTSAACGYPCNEHTRRRKNAYETKALSPHHRFVIALHSPDGVAETGLCVCRPEKNAENLAAGFDETLSPGQFEGKTYGIAAIFSDSSEMPLDFSAVQTAWRSRESGANPSPAKFPANREKYREFANFCPRKCELLSPSCTFCWGNSMIESKS